jgi:AcrR family transcriptional regulator
MTSGAETAVGSGRRRRSSADTRDRLLSAAGELFAERGYEQTTVREIGQRADVDPALIARYFGSKAALYLESLRRESYPNSPQPIDLLDATSVQALLDRIGLKGPTPTLFAAIRPHDDPELQDAAMGFLRGRLLEPTEQAASDRGLDDAELRAEIVMAALAGIVFSRSSQALSVLGNAPSEEVAELVAQLVRSVISP